MVCVGQIIMLCTLNNTVLNVNYISIKLEKKVFLKIKISIHSKQKKVKL